MRVGDKREEALAILVGGGPAPGINGVIAAATIEAINCGLPVVGLREGFHWLAEGDIGHVVNLGIEDVSRIHFTGGSILGTSRTNPARDDAALSRVIDSLAALGVRYLICIGGDDTTYAAARIAEHAKGRLRVATVPKTIDNDLPLPENVPTFGFETARAAGAAIIESLMEDARTTGRWYLLVSMGRKSGSLALSMCKSVGATLALIPEEFRGDKLALGLIVDTMVGAIIKRRAGGHDHGVAIISEGIAERMDTTRLLQTGGSHTDPYGHVHIADIPLGMLLRDRVRAELQQLGIDVTVVTKDIGYELRCAKPVAFDVDYTRTLGYGAVRYLLGGGSNALIAIAGGRVTPIDFARMLDPKTGRIRVRMVDVSTESYEVARSYMIRLEQPDLEEPALSRLARHAQLSSEAFKARFLPSVSALIRGNRPQQ
jgi:ATP-dependent phosphofructokinase / diphosphate-dependent phosphofructokinase